MLPDCRLIPLPKSGHGRQKPCFHGKNDQNDGSHRNFRQRRGADRSLQQKGVDLTETTSFAGDLEWDSLTVMDFVAAIEDEFDILITMNMQAEIETVGQLVDAVAKLKTQQ